MSPPSSEVPYGALDLMVLKTLDTMGAQHGYGIARRIEQMAEGMLALNQGTIYPALLRLEQKGWIESDWGISENNRRARFYSITRCRTEATRDRSGSLVAHGGDDEPDARGIIVMTLRSILMRISASLRRRSLDAALDEEVRGHLDLLARDYERRGLSPEQARLAARRDFGGVEQMKETYRDRSGLRWLDDARRDVHHAFRTLRRSPVFAGAAVLTLAIGLDGGDRHLRDPERVRIARDAGQSSRGARVHRYGTGHARADPAWRLVRGPPGLPERSLGLCRSARLLRGDRRTEQRQLDRAHHDVLASPTTTSRCSVYSRPLAV